MNGIFVADKPSGWTSHDVVAKLRRLARERRIGHLGTLDPLATGVLPLMIGPATRLARFFTNDKRYDAVVQLGVTTDSYDRDGAVICSTQDIHVDRGRLERALNAFRGNFPQKPPPVSAKKVAGIPAYKLARRQIAVDLQPVPVSVYSLELREFDGIRARILLHCSGGTYVRAIAHELGQALGCGAMLGSLRRTSSGDFTEAQAHTLEELQELAAADNLNSALIPASQLLPQFPSEPVDDLAAGQIRQGKDFRVSPFRVRGSARYVKAIAGQGELLAIGEAKLPNVYHPILVL